MASAVALLAFVEQLASTVVQDGEFLHSVPSCLLAQLLTWLSSQKGFGRCN
jgi:hypothetical protein